MRYHEVVSLLGESGLSPESIATRISVSNSTYRRWLKAAPDGIFPQTYHVNVSAGVYKLLGEGLLTQESNRVSHYLQNNLPDFFHAAIRGLNITEDVVSGDSQHQDKITAVLNHIGNSSLIRKRVDTSSTDIRKFTKWGEVWKERICLLSDVIKDKKFSLVDKLVAYGALFYLILPFDLIPDTIPVFGYIDDFGILGFALAYYTQKFPEFTKNSREAAFA